MELSAQILSDIIVHSKYARYIPELKRRETWEEIVTRNKEMHIKKFPLMEEGIEEAYKFVYDKKVLPSMRSMQFAGKPIEINPARLFNCSYIPVNDWQVFSEIMFLLLSGCGVGYSVQKHHVDNLPVVRKPLQRTRRFLVSDSIEGWADAIKILMKSYFYNQSDVVFDFRDIRPKGSRLITSGGKAPGSQPLKDCVHDIRKVLDEVETGRKLRPIEVHDIVCCIADAVLSGGIRRAALISFFSLEDHEMLTAKAGAWYETHPQRGRANNSAVILRHRIEKDVFMNLWDRIEKNNNGEPAFVFSNDSETLFNPCQPGNATLLSPSGITTFDQVEVGNIIWSGKQWTPIINKVTAGEKEVFEYHTTAGIFVGTKEHKVVSRGKKMQAQETNEIDVCLCSETKAGLLNPCDIVDGMVFGDGMVHKASGNLIGLLVGENDKDYFISEVASLILQHRPGIQPQFYTAKTSMTSEELCYTYDRVIPDRFFYGDSFKVRGFLRGLFTANGSINGTRVALKASSFEVIKQVQMMLSSLNIRSYYTTNKSKVIKFKNGSYKCKQSYDLNIGTSIGRLIFANKIGFLQQYKNEKLQKLRVKYLHAGKLTYKIKKVVSRGTQPVYDITVEADEHTYWTGGLLVSNCAEAALKNNTFCNLCEINFDTVVGQEDFEERCRAASFISTLQASYTGFHYLRDVWQRNTEKDSLLGVSLTGIANKRLDTIDLKRGARVVKEENKKIAALLGINKAARLTCVKPSGTSSLVLGTSSGIHAWHSQYYIRRIRVNKDETIYRYLKEKIPQLIEDDFEKPHLGSVISIPVKAPDDAIVRSQENAETSLERIKNVYLRWVKPGHVSGNNTHNISATVSIKEDEWGDVGEWMWENRNFYNGISILPYNDNSYVQTPLEECTEERYNELMLFAKQIDLTEIIEENDETKVAESLSCQGGACEIKSL